MSEPQPASESSLHVLIVGGGVAGLALGQALKRRGIRCSIFERDRTPTDRTQGYRLMMRSVGPNGGETALTHCLDEEGFAFYKSCSGQVQSIGTFVEWTQLKELVTFGTKGVPIGRSVSRLSLRNRILMRGFEVNKDIYFDKKYKDFHYSKETKKVTVNFEDGTSFEGDVLVGADGANSGIRQHLLPQVQRVETGIFGIAGKVRWTPQVEDIVRSTRLTEGQLAVTGPPGWFLFVATHQVNMEEVTGERERNGTGEEKEEEDFLWRDDVPYLFWSLSAPASKFSRFDPASDFASVTQDELLQQARDVVNGEGIYTYGGPWAEPLRTLIDATAPKTTLLVNIRTSQQVQPWRTGTEGEELNLPVTLIGDAIHSMTPFRGIGANTALTDSWKLSDELEKAKEGGGEVLEALRRFEEEMCKRAFEAVKGSSNACWVFHIDGWWSTTLRNLVLRGINLVLNPRRFFWGE